MRLVKETAPSGVFPLKVPVLSAVPVLLALLLAGSAVTMVPQPAYADFDKGGAALIRGDLEEAFQEFKFSTEQGHAGARFMLGSMYEKNEGVSRNYAEAIRLNLASLSIKKSTEFLNELEGKMRPEETAEARRLSREFMNKK